MEQSENCNHDELDDGEICQNCRNATELPDPQELTQADSGYWNDESEQ